MKSSLIFSLCIFFSFLIQADLISQDKNSPILFIYDASGSMWGPMEEKTKKEIASQVLSSAIQDLPVNQAIGLMAYGHRRKSDCDDIEMLVELKNADKQKIVSAVSKIIPTGRTPLARSATLAINSLRETNSKATIILITDGIESCDGKICEVVADAKSEGIDFKLHIIGFGITKEETTELKCAAKSGGGKYYDAVDAGGLSDVLTEATTKTIDDPTDNYSIYATKNGEAVDAWIVAYKAGTKEEVDLARTYGDTAFIHLVPGLYDLAINPLENTDIAGTMITVESKEEEFGHSTVSFDGGTLNIFVSNNGDGYDAIVKMYSKITGKVAASTRTYGRSQRMEVDPGFYDVHFDALKIKGLDKKFQIDNIELRAGESSSIKHNFDSGIARIGVKTTGGELIDATVHFQEIITGTNVAASRTYTSATNNPKEFILSPGTYKVKILTLGKHKGNNKTIEITVKTKETVEKIIKF
jgi:Ca-activated chloride channel family protein